MGFRTNAYAKVWEVKPVEDKNATDIRISISKKNKETGEYTTEFSGYVRLYGEAHKKAGQLSKDDRIKLLSVDVANRHNKETNTTYTYYKLFDWEPADSYTNSGADTEGENNEPEEPKKASGKKLPY